MAATVEELVRGHLRRDEVATEKLVSTFRPVATATALRACGDPHLAEDAAQEALIKALSNLHQLREPERFAEWLATIARNEAHRRSRRRSDCLLDAAIGEAAADALDWLPRPFVPGTARDFSASDTARRVRDALDRLPSRLRRVLELRYYHDCSYEEVARELAIPVTTVTSRLQGARELFREWYEQLENCERCEEQLEAFLDGRLNYEQAGTIHDHLFQCDNCLGQLMVLAAARAEVLAQSANHWNGAIHELAAGIPWELPRLMRRLHARAEKQPHRGFPWMLLALAAHGTGKGGQYAEIASQVEPDSIPGLAARHYLATLVAPDEQEAARLGRVLADAYATRRDEGTLLDRLEIGAAAARMGDLELTGRLLDQTLTHLTDETSSSPSPAALSRGPVTSSDSAERMAAQFGTIELVLGDRGGQTTYELTLLAGALFGHHSPPRLRMVQKGCSHQPLDCSFHGELANKTAQTGHPEPASQALDRALASVSLCPYRSDLQLLGLALALGRLGRTPEAMRYAREYLLRLPPEKPQTSERLAWLLKAIPELRVELPRLLRAPRQT